MQVKISSYTLKIPAGSTTYLANTLSGASIALGDTERQGVDALFAHVEAYGAAPPQHQRVAQLLVDNGFLVPSETDELANALEKYDQGRSNPNIVSLTIATTMECNMGCYYCFEDRTSSAKLATSDIDAIVRFAADRLPADGHLHVTWFGGEPLLQKDFVLQASKALIRLAESLGAQYSASMVSNGYNLDPLTARELQAHRVSGIQVTLDGAEEQHDAVRKHKPLMAPQREGKYIPIMIGGIDSNTRRVGSYQRIVQNITRATDFIRINIRVNVSKQNAPSIKRLIDDLAAAGLADKLASIYFSPIFNFKVSDSNKNYRPTEKNHFRMREFAILEAELLEHAVSHGFHLQDWADPSYTGCIAVTTNGFVIDSNGEVKKCDHELGVPDTAFSSLRDPEFSDTANERKWNEYRPESNPGCDTCVLLPVCYSRCPHQNMVATAEEVDKCPSQKYNWERTLPLVLAQRAARAAGLTVGWSATLPDGVFRC